MDASKVDWREVVDRQPALAQWMLERPEAMPVVKDDAANLKGIEWAVSAPFHAFTDALNEQRLVARQFAEAEGFGSDANRQDLAPKHLAATVRDSRQRPAY